MGSSGKPHRRRGLISPYVVVLAVLTACLVVALILSPSTVSGVIPTASTLSSLHLPATQWLLATDQREVVGTTPIWLNGSASKIKGGILRDTSFVAKMVMGGGGGGSRADLIASRKRIPFQRAFRTCPKSPTLSQTVSNRLRLRRLEVDEEGGNVTSGVLVGPLSMQIPMGVVRELTCVSSAGSYSPRKIAMPAALSFPLTDLLDTKVRFTPPQVGVIVVGPPQLFGSWNEMIVPLSSILRHMTDIEMEQLSAVYLPFFQGASSSSAGSGALYNSQGNLDGPTFLLSHILGHEPQVGRSVSSVTCFCRTIVVNHHRPLLSERQFASSWARERIQKSLDMHVHITNGRKRQVRPQLLLISRLTSRQLGNVSQVRALAELAGFEVTVVNLEHKTNKEKALLASTADVVVGVHGQGLTWSVFMDSAVTSIISKSSNNTAAGGGDGMMEGPTKEVWMCRSIIELRHFGRKLEGAKNVYQGLARDNKHHYESLYPAEVEFGGKVANPIRARDELLARPVPYGHVAFDDQVVYYNPVKLLNVFKASFHRLKKCFKQLEAH